MKAYNTFTSITFISIFSKLDPVLMEIYHSVSLCEYYYINGDYYFVSVTDK